MNKSRRDNHPLSLEESFVLVGGDQSDDALCYSRGLNDPSHVSVSPLQVVLPGGHFVIRQSAFN